MGHFAQDLADRATPGDTGRRPVSEPDHHLRPPPRCWIGQRRADGWELHRAAVSGAGPPCAPPPRWLDGTAPRGRGGAPPGGRPASGTGPGRSPRAGPAAPPAPPAASPPGRLRPWTAPRWWGPPRTPRPA